MPVLGQKQTLRHLQPMSALPPKADIALHRSECPLCAKSGHSAVRQKRRYSNTSSVRASIECGIVGALIRQLPGSLQRRRDDRAGCDARRYARRRLGNLRSRQTCGSEGCRDNGVRVEPIVRLAL